MWVLTEVVEAVVVVGFKRVPGCPGWIYHGKAYLPDNQGDQSGCLTPLCAIVVALGVWVFAVVVEVVVVGGFERVSGCP